MENQLVTRSHSLNTTVLTAFLQYFAAVLRRGDPLNPHSAAYSNPTAYGGQLNTMPGESRVAALRAMTMNSAHWLGMDKDIGSLEMGKMADFVILQRDMIDASTPDALIGNVSLSHRSKLGLLF